MIRIDRTDIDNLLQDLADEFLNIEDALGRCRDLFVEIEDVLDDADEDAAD